MLILGIDTAGRYAGVALLEDDEVLVTRSGIGRHSGLLLPMIAEALESQSRAPTELALIGVTSGPGAYTGLRVGVVTAKVLAHATSAVALGVPTLDAMALQAPTTTRHVLVALHAYKKRLLTAWFDRAENATAELEQRAKPVLRPATEAQTELSQLDSATLESTTVISDSPELLPNLDKLGLSAPIIETSSVSIAMLARARLLAGAADETRTLVPTYLRPPSVTLKKALTSEKTVIGGKE